MFNILAGLPGLIGLVESYESDIPLLNEDSGKLEFKDGFTILECSQSKFSVIGMLGRIVAPKPKTIIKGIASKNISILAMPQWSSNKAKISSNITIQLMLIKSGRIILLAVKNLIENLFRCCVCGSLYDLYKMKLAMQNESTYGIKLQAKCRLKFRFELESKNNEPLTKTKIDNVIRLRRFFNSQYSLIRDLFFPILKPQRSQYANTFVTNYSA